MKLTYLTLLLITISVNSFAFSPSWYKYYGCINNAEQFICKGDYSAAHEQYKMAYAINDKRIANVDLFNAFHIGMIVKDTSFAKKQLHTLLRRGLPEKFIENRILKYYTNQQKNYLRQWVNLYRNDTIILSKTALYVKNLIKRDQDVRLNATGQYYGKEGVDSIDHVDSIVAKELYGVLQKQLLSRDSIGNNDSYPFNELAYGIIILHNAAYAENKKTNFLFGDIIDKGLEQYYFTPNEVLLYALIGRNVLAKKYMGADEPLMFTCVGYNDSLFVPRMNKSKIGKINVVRKKYGLCTIEEEIVKVNYANKVGDKDRFYISGAKNVADTEERDELNKWLKETTYPD